MSDIISGLPNISGDEEKIKKATSAKGYFYTPFSNIDFKNVQSSFGIALHMHQPSIPASLENLAAGLKGNLQDMMENPDSGDNHNATVFLWCYERMAEFITELVDQGKNPRVMLDYSGNLLWGLHQMGQKKVLKSLDKITNDKKYYSNVEWLGTMWSHSVVPSTPVPDIELHIRAWQKHFASIFGYKALSRIKGFSPPEMHLPIHPDVCYEYVRALKRCGYEWLMVQEHTIENLDASPIGRPHFPHKLVAKNSMGQIEEISILIKTQGSDTKLVAQMQPYYEAKTRGREDYAGKSIPPFILQISDGENGGVMMNEFPPAYKQAYGEIDNKGTVALNGTEYLEFIRGLGAREQDFTGVQPVSQHKIWECFDSFGPGSADAAIEKAHQKDGSFNLDKGSWTSDKNWVKGYEDILDPINKLSAEFHNKMDKAKIDTSSKQYREALLYLLVSQTSCFRYWGEGLWTEYAKGICNRGFEVLKKK